MARSFSSGNYLSRSSPANPGNTGTIFLRFKPTWSSGDGQSHGIMRWSIASPLALFDFVKDAAGDRCYIGFYNSGSDYRINIPDTGLFSSGVLGNWRIEWDTGGTHLYLNNSSVGTIGVAQTIPTGFESLYIGAYTDGSGSASGEISDLGQWNRRLSTDEEFILEATGCPLHVPLGLVRYSPIIGRHSPEIDLVGGENLTLTGTPAAAPHPRIFLPYAQSDYFVAGALTHYSLTADVGAFPRQVSSWFVNQPPARSP